MILFINTFITNKRFSSTNKPVPNDKRYAPPRTEVFKYMIASLSVIKWEKIIIYYELDDEYKNFYESIDDFILSEFDCRVEIHHFRNAYQEMWRLAVNKLDDYPDDKLIWFCCEDDHIYIDNNLQLLGEIELKMKDLLKNNEYVTCLLSHWPELMRLRVNKGKFKRDILEDNQKFYVVNWKNSDGMSIINKKLLKFWWLENSYGERIMRRTDDPVGGDVVSPKLTSIIPYKEQLRHFDGYGHVGINPNDCPPLFIPNGFFESNIKISAFKKPPTTDYVYLDPSVKSNKSFTNEGSDLTCFLNELPLFWKNRIAKIIKNKYNITKINSHRNISLLRLACSDKRAGFLPLFIIKFLKESYFKDQNKLQLFIDSLFVWNLKDYRIFFSHYFKKFI